MNSKLKHYKLSELKARVFQGELAKHGLAHMGYHTDDEENWVAYHHHDSGALLVVKYNQEVDKNNAIMLIRGLERAIEETLASLNRLNLGIVEYK